MKNLIFGIFLFLGGAACATADSVVERQGFIEVPGGPVWYKAVGEGPGVPLLVLHGGPGGTSCNFSVLEPLGAKRPLIRYDQLGTGRSGRPDDPSLWTVEHFVEELDAVRHALGLERMHLMGHSWGGALAAAYVLKKGTEGIVSLTLSSPLLSTPRWVEDANLLRAQLPADVQHVLTHEEQAGTLDSEAYQHATELFYERHVYGGPRPAPLDACAGAPWNSVIYEYMWGPTEFKATGTLLDFDVTPRLHEIDVPTLFVCGEFDEARPETVAAFHDLVPGSRFEVIGDAAHLTIYKKTEQYMQMLEGFMESAEAEARSTDTAPN